MRSSNWSLCHKRAAIMCKAYGMTAEMHAGNTRCGVSYTISFWCGNQHIHELQDRTPAGLFTKLSAFDWGMTSRDVLTRLKKEA
jgi:hypothetical protein